LTPRNTPVASIRSALTKGKNVATVLVSATIFFPIRPEAALVRLRSPPMDVAEGGLMLIWCFVLLNRVRMPDGRVVRRVLEATEVEPKDGTIALRRIFLWNARDDTFAPWDAREVVKRSHRLGAIMRLTGWNEGELAEELVKRAKYLEAVVESGKLDYPLFAETIRRFYITERRRIA
jgi:hypothetical protein